MISLEQRVVDTNGLGVFLVSLRATCRQKMQAKARNQLGMFPRKSYVFFSKDSLCNAVENRVYIQQTLYLFPLQNNPTRWDNLVEFATLSIVLTVFVALYFFSNYGLLCHMMLPSYDLNHLAVSRCNREQIDWNQKTEASYDTVNRNLRKNTGPQTL